MDEVYMTKVATSFIEELSEIEKQAFLGKALRFVSAGGKRLLGVGKQLAGGKAGLTQAVGGKGATRVGGVGEHMKQIYQAGAKSRGAGTIMTKAGPKAVSERAGGTLGGLGALARSRYGQMGAAGALGVGGLALGSRALSSRRQQRPPGY